MRHVTGGLIKNRGRGEKTDNNECGKPRDARARSCSFIPILLAESVSYGKMEIKRMAHGKSHLRLVL